MKYTLCACLLLISLPLIASDVSDWTSDRQDITRTVLDPDFYDKRVRPSGDGDETTLIAIEFHPLVINDIDSVGETMITTAWMGITWIDDRLTWDNENSEDNINVPQDEIWRPDVSLKNSNTDPKPLGNKYIQVDLEHDGNVYWFPYHVFHSYCDLDTTYFPFDTQTCELQFTAWSYHAFQVSFSDPKISMDSYQPSNSFDVTNYTAFEEEITDTSVAIFRFELRRKPQFILMTTVVPIVTLAFLSICVFLLPVESGEKISYSVTVFLAFMVTLTYVSTILPENSDTISYLAVYVSSQVAQSTLQTFVTIILIKLHHYDAKKKPIPKVLVFLVSKFCCLQKRNSTQETHSRKRLYEKPQNEANGRIPQKGKNGSSLSNHHPGGNSYETESTYMTNPVALVYMEERGGRYDRVGEERGSRYDMIEDVPERDYPAHSLEKKRATVKDKVTWKLVVNGLDLFFFIFFSLLCAACTLLYVVLSAFHV